MSNDTVLESRQHVIDALKRAIAETLRRSGRNMPDFDNYKLRPILDVEGFDSQCGIEVTVELETILGIADLTNNIFIKVVNKRARARTFDEVVDAILCCMGGTQ
jgi:hypothetical protein